VRPEVQGALSGALTKLVPLPVLSGTVARVRTMAGSEDVATEQLVEVIERDEAFALNLLGFANSASAARPVRARNVRHAVTLIGRRAVSRLASEAVTYRFLEQVPGSGRVTRGQLHTHAIAVASAACVIAERTGADVEVAHLAGLLHDVGKLVLPLAFGAEAVEAIIDEAPGGARRAALEYERLGVDHAYAGALLARLSHADAEVCEAIQFHHGGRSGQEAPSATTACVQLGNALTSFGSGGELDEDLVRVALNALSLPLEALDDLAEEISLPPTTSAPDGLAQKISELERLAHTDELTGLANRRQWMHHLTAALQGSEPGSLLLCDVDRFKEINDTAGHRAGDLVLVEIARILAQFGTAGRLGGDEFAVWVTGAAHEGQEAADAIVGAVSQHLAGTLATSATVSIGLATAFVHGDEPQLLLEVADGALYAAKAAGRARALTALPVAI
jgi:diguanylate cyclase (GGDEF)-like protein/putative nucleotidyltransferase with HDIG domain